MADLNSKLNAISQNVTNVAATVSSVLGVPIQTAPSTTTSQIVKGVADFSTDDFITIGKKLHQNIGSYFNYENYILNIAEASSLPNGAYSLLPVVFLDGDITNLSKENKVDLSYKIGRIGGKYFEGTCQCKYQGNTTWNTPKHNYALSKMSEKVDLGWGPQKKYVLKGEYREASYARNVVAAKLWADVVKSRTDTSELLTKIKSTPNCCAVDGYPCMLILNGKYRGVFTLNIPKDKWMMNIGDGEKEAILQCDGRQVNIQRWKSSLTKEILTTEDLSMSIEYVTDEDDVDWVVDSWNNIYSIISSNQNNANYLDLLSPYVDITNAIDYYIYCCLTGNWDGTSHNFLFSTYDGMKWFYTAYDLNFVFGLYLATYTMNSRTARPTFSGFASENNLMKLFYTHSKNLIKSRYTVLRDGPMSEANVLTRFSDFLIKIPERCRQAEYEIYTDEPSTSVEHLSQIMNWYRLRCQYLDAEVASWNV